MALGLYGPTVLDLQQTARTSLGTASFAFTAETAGALVGGIVCSKLLQHFNPWMLLTVSAVLVTISITAIPLCPNAGLLLSVAVVNGCASGVYEIGRILVC